MKKLSVTIFVVLFGLGLLAQDNLFQKGDKVVNLGLGLGSTLYSGAYYRTRIPPVSASFELGYMDGIIDNGSIGIGGYVGFSSSKWETNWLGLGSYGWTYSSFILGARGAFHYPFVDKLDTYTGIMIGYNLVTSKYFGDPTWNVGSAARGGIIWSWYAGGRYYFTDNLAAMAEIGYGIAYLNLGIALKLRN